MADRYGQQVQNSFKPKMWAVEGFVSVGTGGQLNFPDPYPIWPSATGPTGVAGQTGAPRGLMPGQSTAGVPTGWQGGFSGCVGLLGAGIQGIQRVATGLYAIVLSDDWYRLDSVEANPYLGATGATNLNELVIGHTVGYGNTVQTGGVTVMQQGVMNPKNTIWIQFHASGTQAELPAGGGFHLDIRLRNSSAGPQ